MMDNKIPENDRIEMCKAVAAIILRYKNGEPSPEEIKRANGRKASHKKWRDKNKEKILGYALRWQKAHPGKVKEYAKKSYQKRKRKTEHELCSPNRNS